MTAGGVQVIHIARWDGAAWSALAGGMGGWVSALAVGADGSLYAAGEFLETMSGVVVNHIARWDGSVWHPLGSGTDRYWVYELAVGPDGSLYAGGDFTMAGGVAASGIARWDGTMWRPLGSGVGAALNPYVQALAFGPDGALYAGGNFTTAGGTPANFIARWNGAEWRSLGGGMNDHVGVLAFVPDGSLYAGGAFTLAGGKSSSHIAKWIGATRYRTMLPLVRHAHERPLMEETLP